MIFTSSLIVLDESRLVFISRKIKHGNLPKHPFIKQKLGQLGTDFKVTVNGIIGKCFWLEIQESKDLFFVIVLLF